jgi:hypothetical protein
VSPADVAEKARRCGVNLALNDTGTGLSLRADSAPPKEIVDLVRDARDVLVAHLQQKRAIRLWINDGFTAGQPGVCMHCGGHSLADESTITVCCGDDYGNLHNACWGAWEAEQDRRARQALGFA